MTSARGRHKEQQIFVEVDVDYIVLDRDESLILSVRFRCDNIVDLFSRVCVALRSWLYVLLFFLFCLSVFVYLVPDVRFNNK